MGSHIYIVGLITAMTTFVVSCQGDTDSSRRRKFFGGSGSGEFTTVDVEAASTTEDSALSLAGDAVSTMKLKVSCDNVAEQVVEDSQFDLPVGATNCKAKLVSIKIGDKTYVEPAAGSGFTHYLKNDVGHLVNANDAKDQIFLKVKRQLPSPLTSDSNVQYVYSAVTQFDTVDASSAPSDSTLNSVGIAAPKVKVARAYFATPGDLNVLVECTATNGFAGSALADLKCDGVELAKMKFALAAQDEGAISNARLTEIAKNGKAVNQFATPSVYNLAGKFVRLHFATGASNKTHALVASISENNQSSYSYGFIRLGGSTISNVDAQPCPAQGDQANFIQVGVQLDKNLGRWRDTSNCWVWMRPVTGVVKSKQRFDQCPRLKDGEVEHHLTLPFYTEMKAAYDRKIHELAKGAAPALGADLADGTFWLAGGRVFNMKDGTVKEVKDIKPNEQHKTLCVIKRD